MLEHQHCQTTRLPRCSALPGEVEKFRAKAFLKRSLAQEFIQQVLSVMHVRHETPDRREILLLAALTAAATFTAATALTAAAIFAFTLVFAFVFLPFLLFLFLGSGQGAERDHKCGVQGFGTITLQYDGDGVGDIFAVALAFVFLPLAIRLAGHKFLLQG